MVGTLQVIWGMTFQANHIDNRPLIGQETESALFLQPKSPHGVIVGLKSMHIFTLDYHLRIFNIILNIAVNYSVFGRILKTHIQYSPKKYTWLLLVLILKTDHQFNTSV